MKIAAIIAVSVFLLIQFISVETDNPVTDPSDEIKIQGEVKMIIQTACYNCHSNKTKWPWYSYVAPVSWLVASDVHEGRDEINFSVWNTYTEKRKNRKFQELVEEVEEEEMPLPIYTIMHSEADLDQTQRAVLINWAKSHIQKNPGSDSLSTDN